MMIHSEDTSATDGAVVGARGPHALAAGAVRCAGEVGGGRGGSGGHGVVGEDAREEVEQRGRPERREERAERGDGEAGCVRVAERALGGVERAARAAAHDGRQHDAVLDDGARDEDRAERQRLRRHRHAPQAHLPTSPQPPRPTLTSSSFHSFLSVLWCVNQSLGRSLVHNSEKRTTNVFLVASMKKMGYHIGA